MHIGMGSYFTTSLNAWFLKLRFFQGGGQKL